MADANATTRVQDAEAITGVHLMQGLGHQPAKGFWADAWSQVIRRPGAIFGLLWIAIVGFFAIAAPLVANGHPLILRELDELGNVVATSSPLWEHLTAVDLLLLIGGVAGLVWMCVPMPISRGVRLGILVAAAIQAGLIVVIAHFVSESFGGRDASPWMKDVRDQTWFRPTASAVIAFVVSMAALIIPFTERLGGRILTVVLVGVVTGFVVADRWSTPLEQFNYRQREARGKIETVYTLIPWSTNQGDTSLYLLRPGATLMTPVVLESSRALRMAAGSPMPTVQDLRQRPLSDVHLDLVTGLFPQFRSLLHVQPDILEREIRAAVATGEITTIGDALDWLSARPSPRFLLGTDSLGQDVLTQLLRACRLSISIGLVSTGIAVMIGVCMGALMGYFGGWVDMALYRVVEIFMAIPLLFMLIVAAAVLPRDTYIMMAIIGCVTWTRAARFIRAEFYKLREQDFVQSARAVGLPLRSILFRHMLPNGVTPVLVDSSFAIAAAINFEAVLSFLGLGPANQASWGRLLSDATNQVGDFVWWLAIFPGFAIFLTVLAYNLIGEALRDAIDPKLKKARV